MDEHVTYTEEFETIIELIVSIIFMSFCIFATAYMVAVISPRTAITYEADKLTELSSYDVTDPTNLTGYQAYMMAWHMDNISEVPIMYMSTGTTIHNPGTGNDADTDSCVTKDEHVIMSVLDRDINEVRSNFINWRNRHITGALLPTGYSSVQSIVNNTASNLGLTDSEKRFFWSGTGVASKYRFHLEHTYLNMEASDASGRKDSIWQLNPIQIP